LPTRPQDRADTAAIDAWLARVADTAPQYVYFAQVDGGPIKIGVARNPIRRLAQMRTGNPAPIRLLGVIRGNTQTELEIHNLFAAENVAGEWFEPSRRLLAFIEATTKRQP
jgi:hypothetical protein